MLPVTLIPCSRGYGDQQSLAAARNLMERLLQCMSPDLARLCRHQHSPGTAAICGQAAVTGDGARRLKMTLAV
jgi:hypothetical protein